MQFDAILLVSFGGPESMDEVMPFLERVTAGRGIPRDRLLAVAEHYGRFGGRSPLNEQARALRDAVEQGLRARGVTTPVALATRFVPPYVPDVARELGESGAKRVLAFTMSAFSSASSCRAYVELLDAASTEGPALEKVRQYWNHPGFLAACAARLREVPPALPGARRRVFFSAHAIPVAMAKASRYEAQLAEAMRWLAAEVGIEDARLVYQSRSGPPAVPWLEPDVGDAIRAAAEEGVDDIVVFPLGFTSDHVEVIWDLDHEARAIAASASVRFHRAATVGTHPAFVDGLVDLILERMESRPSRATVAGFSPEPDRCAPDCCAYASGRPPRS